MSKNKLSKFADILTYSNVYENFDPKKPSLSCGKATSIEMKGKWAENHFKNNHPLVLELACGRGEYSVALGVQYPEKNFIGVDVKGARIWQGATIAIKNNIANVAFLRTRIEQLGLFVGEKEIDEIWITFPDPFLRESKENKRLTSAAFLDRYQSIIKPGCIFHLKTDDPTLYTFTKDTLAIYPNAKILYDKDDIYASPLDFVELNYKTYYELSHLDKGRKIKFLRFTIN